MRPLARRRLDHEDRQRFVGRVDVLVPPRLPARPSVPPAAAGDQHGARMPVPHEGAHALLRPAGRGRERRRTMHATRPSAASLILLARRPNLGSCPPQYGYARLERAALSRTAQSGNAPPLRPAVCSGAPSGARRGTSRARRPRRDRRPLRPFPSRAHQNPALQGHAMPCHAMPCNAMIPSCPVCRWLVGGEST